MMRRGPRGPYMASSCRGSRLALLRYKAGLTQKQCGAILGLSERQYWAIERADFVTDAYVEVLAACFGMDREALAQELDNSGVPSEASARRGAA